MDGIISKLFIYYLNLFQQSKLELGVVWDVKVIQVSRLKQKMWVSRSPRDY